MIRDPNTVKPGQVLSTWIDHILWRGIVMDAPDPFAVRVLWENGEINTQDITGKDWNTVLAPTVGIPEGS